MKSHEELEKKINRSLNSMKVKISHLHKSIKGLNQSFKGFHEDISEYMAFTAESYADHERRLSVLEKKIG
ncbi:MAG: hypothetical protein RIG77_21025 [Cyclobacteriaceae bacterium]